MSRDVKRVPLGFDWPLHQVWPGYRWISCDLEDCDGECAWCSSGGNLPQINPPTGDGWQVWESVSEGSPVSQVFPTREALIAWLTSPDADGPMMGRLSAAAAEAFVTAGFAPTFVFGPSGFTTGAQVADELFSTSDGAGQ